MKKNSLLLLAIIVSLSITQNANGQAFEKGNLNADVGLGIGAYSTVTTFTFDFFGTPITLTDKDGAASTMIPVSFEYGISNKFGLGLQLGTSNYFIDNEDSTETTESVKSFDWALKVNYHLLNADKNDLFIGLAVGGSSVKWLDMSGESFTGAGSYASLYITDRIFFNDHIGILFNLGYTAYNYSGLESSSNNTFIENFEWSLTGVNIGTGLALKF